MKFDRKKPIYTNDPLGIKKPLSYFLTSEEEKQMNFEHKIRMKYSKKRK